MGSSCTITRLVRWRVKDWASCFKFPIDEEPDMYIVSSPYIPKDKTRINEQIKENRYDHDHDNDNNIACNQERELSSRPKKERELSLGAPKIIESSSTDSSNCPHFTEEDYIVFCFKEDGAIHVTKDRRKSEEASSSSAQINSQNGNLKPVNRKLMYIEKVEKGHESIKDQLVNEAENEKYTEIHIMDRQGGEQSGQTLDTERPPDEIKEIKHIKETRNECKTGSIESSAPKLSDSSTSSFTFPVFGSQGIESPVQMPKPERLGTRKPKERKVLLQCCRF